MLNITFLDANANPCPIGVPGELYISGGASWLGHYIVADENLFPILFLVGKRLYRTGDLALLPCQMVTFSFSPIDHQVIQFALNR